jgi:hypothetical protein
VFLVRTRKRNCHITNQLASISARVFLLLSERKTKMKFQKPNHPINPRGFRADDAAAYLGMGKTKFLELVSKGMAPRAVLIDGVKVWDRFDLDAMFDAAKDDTPSEQNSFDKIMRR